MRVIHARNVNSAYRQIAVELRKAIAEGLTPTPSRAGPVYELGHVTTVYSHPQECVLFDAQRDANPFFHLYESLWMLAGRNDVASLTHFNKKMSDFSDDKTTFHGAYGFRWRNHFEIDQLDKCVEELTNNKDSRRAVVTMWDPRSDLCPERASLDLPCNMQVKFEVRDSSLNMTVFNRSNDIIWGAYGANAVHFSLLQQYMAFRLRCKVGTYWQVSANFHTYVSTYEKHLKDHNRFVWCPYTDGEVCPATGNKDAPTVFSLLLACESDPADCLENDIRTVVDRHDSNNIHTYFLREVARPMIQAWDLWKGGNKLSAYKFLHGKCEEYHSSVPDWLYAGLSWMNRRIDRGVK